MKTVKCVKCGEQVYRTVSKNGITIRNRSDGAEHTKGRCSGNDENSDLLICKRVTTKSNNGLTIGK